MVTRKVMANGKVIVFFIEKIGTSGLVIKGFWFKNKLQGSAILYSNDVGQREVIVRDDVVVKVYDNLGLYK